MQSRSSSASTKPTSTPRAGLIGLVVSTALGFAALALVAGANSGCAQLEEALLGEDAGSDTADAATTDAASGISYPDGGDTEGDAATGTNCGTESTTGAVLCTGISACPDITVSQTTLTGCGFRIRGGEVLDLECGCSGELCPIGAPTTCAEATQLLQNQTLPSVCVQVSEGHCTTPGSTSTTTSGTSSTCDQSCAANCVGSAPCLQMCGC